LASWKRQSEVVKVLLEKGADIEAKDEDGQTSLMWASYRGYSEVVELLLENGANIEAKDNRGKTALDLVENDKVKKMLEDARNKNSFLYKIKRGFGMGD
jgi:ankyrin repeat protein